VLTADSGTIGAARNRGVARATGDVIVFIDADVLLTPAWADRFPDVVEQLEREPRMITGSICSVPSRPSWIERYWFAPRSGRHS
jgi:glycosyltransferase involved in cell wall biosynthesis